MTLNNDYSLTHSQVVLAKVMHLKFIKNVQIYYVTAFFLTNVSLISNSIHFKVVCSVNHTKVQDSNSNKKNTKMYMVIS